MAGPTTALLLLLFSLFLHPVHSQNIATDTPVPPLQWINLTPVLKGTNKPPPLINAAIGYDPLSSSIIIFGGESQAGLAQSQTYLLSLSTLSWSSPLPPNNLGTIPPARSAALYGDDFAASNRHGFLVIGGKGLDGKPLSDVWEYSYTNQFWSQVKISQGSPSARYAAAGGIDSRVSPNADPIIPGPNNTFYMAGGFNGDTGESLSDLWRLSISGTLSPNLPNSVQGSWEELHVGDFPSVMGPANTVVSSTVISTGGCNTSSVTDSSCVTQNTYKLDIGAPATADACPAPRRGATMVPNLNTVSSTFGSQVFLLLGTVDTSMWSDDGGSQKGEVAILNTGTGVWTRVLPSGDPGTTGQEAFPSAREGSVAVSSSSALVGAGGSRYSDTIVFGGRDSSGNYLSEVWLLRAYSDMITPSKPEWAGFGNGQLQTGVNSTGAGVKIQYLDSCATRLASSPTATSSSPSHSASTSGTASAPTAPSDSPQRAFYDTSISHKALSSVSLAVFLPAFLLFRSYSPPFNTHERSPQHIAVVYFSGVLILVSYGSGVAGLVMSFTSLSFTPTTLSKRSDSSITHLQTAHGRAALAFFLGLYALVPLLCLLAISYNPSSRRDHVSSESEKEEERERATATSIDTAEKLRTRNARSPAQSVDTVSRPSSPRHRTHSWGPSTLWHPSHERRVSDDSDSISSAAPRRTFEVTNRPNRTRRSSAGLHIPLPKEPRGISRSLGEIDWLQRRRSLGAVGELDYALTQAIRARDTPSTPATMEALLLAPTPAEVESGPILPSSLQIVIRSLLHTCLIGLCGVILAALWIHAPRATFAVFLVWLVLFYIVIVVQAWYQYPHTSILATMITRLRAEPHLPPSQSYAPSTTPPLDQYPFPTSAQETQGPYAHEPPYRIASDDQLHQGLRSVENDDDDDDEDEDARQRRIESEMGRREIAIVTTQLKRKLWVANPS